MLLGYAVPHLHWALIIFFAATSGFFWFKYRDNYKSKKIQVKAEACSMSKEDLIKKIDELPSWVKKLKNIIIINNKYISAQISRP